MARLLAWSDRWLAPRGVARDAPESYGYLARRLDGELPGHDRGRLIVFSSAASPATGNEAIWALAQALREELGRTVLIVDGTFRDDGVGGGAVKPSARGPSELGGEAATRLDPSLRQNSDVWILSTAHEPPLPPRSASIDIARRLSDQIGEARSVFDYTLLQQAGVHEDSRYVGFLKDADLILILAEEGRTRLADLERGQRVLRRQGLGNARILLVAEAA